MKYKIALKRTVMQKCEAVVDAATLDEAKKIAASAEYCMTNGVAIHSNDKPLFWVDARTPVISSTVTPVEE